jgi:UDP-glucose 4-epimerase
MNSTQVTITGGAGFIGSQLAKFLISKGYFVVVIDNLSRGKLKNLDTIKDNPLFTYFKGDVTHHADVTKAIKGSEFVFHMASDCINRSIKHTLQSFKVNIEGSYNVFKTCIDEKIKRVIYSSSASVYGDPLYLPIDEGHPFQPITPYCLSKVTCEKMLKMLEKEGLNYNVLRYFNVYGVKQHTDAYYTSVINLFVKKVLKDEIPTIHGDGNQSMDFINVKDLVQANYLAMLTDIDNEIYNVASGTQTTINELADLMLEIMGKDIEFNYQSGIIPIVKRRKADLSKIQSQLNFIPSISLKTGLEEVIEDIKKHPDEY